MHYDVIVVGAGLAGLTATCELIDAGKKVLLVDQEPENSIGGQAFWSFGGLFLVDSPEQRRMGIKDNKELAWQDWCGAAGFDRLEDEDSWGYKWAKAYVDFAAGEKYDWLKSNGIQFFPVVGWAERGGALAGGHGNSVPRFHIVWGTGPGLVEPFVTKVLTAVEAGYIDFKPRHQVTELMTKDFTVTSTDSPSYAGGIVGWANKKTIVSTCVNTGRVLSTTRYTGSETSSSTFYRIAYAGGIAQKSIAIVLS